jgi:hypothetical protein
MKRLFLIFTLAFAVPAIAFAQQDPSNSPSPQMRAQMRANFGQMEALHKQYRAAVLGALTPAHKQLYASVVGELAIAASPDPRAAVAKLDGALSSGEKAAIVNADTQFRAAMKAQFAQIRAAHPRPSPSGSPRPRRSHKPYTPDAGRILLAMAGGHGGMMMRGPGMRGGWGGSQKP